MKLYVENCPRITIEEIVKMSQESNKSIDKTFKNIFGESAIIGITETKLTFGIRKWFVCPDCKRRIRKLYLVNNTLSCHLCHNLYYADRSKHRDKHFESVIRPLKKSIKIEHKNKKDFP